MRFWLVATITGVVLVEVCWRLVQWAWWRHRAAALIAAFSSFSAAVGDEARQRTLLQAGRRALGLGLAALAAVALLAALLECGVSFLVPGEGGLAGWLAVSGTASAWWAVRWLATRRRREPR